MLQKITKNQIALLFFSLISGGAFAAGTANQSVISLPTPNALPASNRTYKGELIFALQGKRFDDPVVNSRFSRAIISLNLEASYEEFLTANLGASQLLTSGQATNLYAVTEGGTGSGLFVDEASLTLKPFKGLSLTGGIIQVDLNPLYSQLYTQSNAGGMIRYTASNITNKLQIQASQSIPTSKGTSSAVVDDGALPLLTVLSLKGETTLTSTQTTLKLGAARFQFTDPSSQSAADSQQTGSTTIGNGKGGFLFAYDFRGNELAAILEQKLFLEDSITLKANRIKNELAPSGHAEGWMARGEYSRAFRKYAIIPSMTRFHMESDALPSVYGFTNRDGVSYGLKFDFPKEKFNVFGSYVKANVIDTSSTAGIFQADREVYTIGAEAKYDIF